METNKFWWIKTPQKSSNDSPKESLIVPKLDLQSLHSSDILSDFLRKEAQSNEKEDIDVGSIIEEINRVAAQSPLGPFERSVGERSIDDIMREAEKIYMESSKSFEQLSQRSKTSQNISDLMSTNSKASTPTPKSISPLPIDSDGKSDYSSYSEDFSQESKIESEQSSKESSKLEHSGQESGKVDESQLKLPDSPRDYQNSLDTPSSRSAKSISLVKNSYKLSPSLPVHVPVSPKYLVNDQDIAIVQKRNQDDNEIVSQAPILGSSSSIKNQQENEKNGMNSSDEEVQHLHQEISLRNGIIQTLEEDNNILKHDIQTMRTDLQNTQTLLEKLKKELNTKVLQSPVLNIELEKALEDLKDTKEINTSLQLQLDTVNKTHQLLKSSYEDLVSSNKNLERKVVELDSTLGKYKGELLNAQQVKSKLIENEINLNKLLEIEKLQTKSLKLQNEKDSKCIQDLNRQIKEMERIIARKHPDSVSALIVAAKEDAVDTNLSARRLLEDRIKTLEQEVSNRDSQSSRVFLDIQEKFNQMKNKYESHIEDLELHVSDLKAQLKTKSDTYDVYTQTFLEDKLPQKETFSVAIQTVAVTTKPKNVMAKKTSDRESIKEDAHLLATIRGLQTDLSNKEKVIVKLQKELEESKKTNRRLQKEREGSLRNLSERKDFRSYPEKLASQSMRSESIQDFRKEEEIQQMKLERDRLKHQLAKLEEDYQSLKKKRLDDLTALQEAHEREIANYMTSVTPLREQLELQQVTINTLQTQLTKAKEELAVINVERDHLNNRLYSSVHDSKMYMKNAPERVEQDNVEIDALLKKIAFLEKRYEDREHRLKAVIQSITQNPMTSQSCDQCAERQRELVGYKIELDQLLAAVRALK
ncbi:centrosomal protein of 162 kDa [Sitophilus oryzae]|uniref:Centrosomal protein of 162 kDa n=1 Tax=Sitophilus oryzae TaxID=7048 RepID=A0A6J2YC70_SITOR|nr:centrosomal protein of 162 kDa [Sitophilus oryzae]